MIWKNALVSCTILFSATCLAPDWPFWKGPEMDGIAKGEKWSPDAVKGGAKVLWKAELGPGYSMVAVKDGKVYALGNKDDNDIIFCFEEASGKILWEYKYRCKAGGGYPGPRSSPVVKDGLVFVFSREGDIVCVGAGQGDLKWTKNLQNDFGAKGLKWNFSSSPTFDGDRVLVNAGEHGMAFDMKTGKAVWKNSGGVGNYAAAIPFTFQGKKFVAVFAERSFCVVNASDGSKAASVPWETKYDVNASDPIILDGGARIFIASGYGYGCAMLNFDGKTLRKEWENKNLCPHFNSPVLMGGHIYGLDGNVGGGRLVCLDASSGILKWRKELGFGAMTVADDKVIFLSENGEIIVFKVAPEGCTEIARGGSGIGPKCWNMPVLSNGRLYCRNDRGQFVCIDVSR